MANENTDFVTLPINLMEMLDKDFLSSDLLGEGEERIYTIKGIRQEKLVNEKNNTEDIKPVVYFEETDKKLALKETNVKTIQKIYGETRADLLVGKKIQIFKTSVKAFGSVTGCLRIRPFVPELKCCVCGKETPEDIYFGSIKKYGRPYCCKECLEKDKKGKQLL